MLYKQITVDIATFERLWQSKERFRALTDGKLTWSGRLTWSDFLEQAALFLEARYSFVPSVNAIRYNPYVYGADCPNCGTEEYPLRRRKRIIWKIKCRKCGKEYIALA